MALSPSGTYAYVANGKLAIWDIQNLYSPALVSTYGEEGIYFF
jgi:hypothetical protein